MSTVNALAEQARTTVSSLTPEQFAAEADELGTVVVDVREADERVTSGSIAYAVHVPRGLLEFRADPTHTSHHPQFQPDARVLLYCSDGVRSALAAASLHALGYTNIAHLEGGLSAWDTAQLPRVHPVPSPY